MAERTIILNAKVDTGNSANDLKDVDKAMDGYQKGANNAKKSTTDLNATFEDIHGDIKPLSSRLGELEDRMYELALAGKQNTKEYKELQREAVRYRKTIIQADAAVDGLAQTGSGIGAALELGEGVVAGYQGFVGVTALMGDENEQLLETITKLQAAQGVLSSIQQARLIISKESLVVTKGQALASRVAAGAQLLYATAVGTATGATKAFRIALLATGIGAIVVGIGLLITNFDKLTGWVSEAVDWFYNLGDGAKTFIRVALPIIPLIEGITAAYNYFFGESEKVAEGQRKVQEELRKTLEAERKKVDELNKLSEEEIKISDKKIEAIDWEVRKRQAAGRDTVALEEEKLNELIKIANEEIKMLQRNIEYINKVSEARENSSNFQKSLYNASTNVLKESQNEQENLINEYNQEIELIEIKSQTKRNDNAKKAAEERKAIEKELNDFILSLRQERFEMENTQEAVRLAEIRQEMLDRKAELDRFRGENLISEEEYQNQLAEIQSLARQKSQEVTDELRAIKLEQDQIEIQDEEDKQSGMVDAISRASQERIRILQQEQERRKQILDFGVQSTLSAFNNIANIAEGFAGDSERRQKRAFQIQKAANIAEATVETFKGATTAFASAQQLGPIAGPIVGGINAALVVGAGLANINKIRKQQFEGGGGGSPSSSTPRSGGSSMVSGVQQQTQESINLFGQANEGGTTNLGGGSDSSQGSNQNVTITAQVVESDITTAQNNTSTIQSRFEL